MPTPVAHLLARQRYKYYIPEMTKRQRCDDPAWWSLLCDDVISNGGFVHPDLEFMETTRTLTASEKVGKDNLLLRIPSKNFMTRDRAISICQPWLKEILATRDTSVKWTNSTADIAIAVAMATCSSDSYLYLHSLPESSSFDALPRRWSDEEIQSLLSGTSLLRHVVSAKAGASEDYKILLEGYRNFQKGNNNERASHFPSFQKFSDMLAAVTSRAFQIGNTDEEVAIVPILDLGNHTRGKSETKLGRKNVSYEYDGSKDSMIVKAAADIGSGESIRLTYGAKANAQLFLNYGFCIPHNIEPDGSSNDILEFRPLSTVKGDVGSDSLGRFGGNCMSLRAGPKSYSYGGFVAALEEYFDSEKSTSIPGNGNDRNDALHDSSIENKEENGMPSDFEDFLNGCENEEEEGEDFMDLYDGGNTQPESETGDTSAEKNEIEALKRFKLDLIKLSQGYNECNGADSSTSMDTNPGITSSKLYSMILSISELRTIFFFLRTIDKVLGLLHAETNEEKKSKYATIDVFTDADDLDMIDKQTDELAKTFMSIRHGFF